MLWTLIRLRSLIGARRAAAPIGPVRLELAVALQDLGASGSKLFAVLFQARQDVEIALIDHGATVPLHVTGTSLLLVRRAAVLRKRSGGESER
jgi:hypothetical protein